MENKPNDGADEQMLGNEKNALAQKTDDVKFIKNGDAKNGDAKVEMGMAHDSKDFTGMSKEVLMKYANDPFWVRLRWIFFLAFWLIWVMMLIGAILIIIGAPKCSAPANLTWFNRGPLLKANDLSFATKNLDNAEKLQPSGIIFEIPPKKTYDVGTDTELDAKIDSLIDTFKKKDVKLILDITPNYVPKESKMFQDALKDKSKRSAFIWEEGKNRPNNWVSHNNEPAWQEVEPRNFVLSQFGENLYDLHMNSSIVMKNLDSVLETLIKKGVKGFRLKNSKYFMLSRNLEDEFPSNDNPSTTINQYHFWTHSKTSFHDGLGNYLADLKAKVNVLNNDVMLTVADDMVRPEVYQTNEGSYGVDTPRYGRLMHVLNSDPNAQQIFDELNKIKSSVGNHHWLQWNLEDLDENNNQDPSALTIFISLIPGVYIIPSDSYLLKNISKNTFKQLSSLRNSPSFMHGEFNTYHFGKLVAYARIKSGNPGYLIVMNPTETEITANLSKPTFPEKMRVNLLSKNYNVTHITEKSQMNTNSITVSPKSTIILSYVPTNSD